ncbi:MAG: hypothetical protein SH850_08020 [Planctomycetaceae bacterium]|nr:hypothetical protein [Planctomycetaceae bacterium]
MPSPNSSNGRDDSGKFLPGNAGGPGNPHAGRVSKLRAALLNAITEDDITAVAKAIVESAKLGDVAAAKLLFERCLGRPGAGDDSDDQAAGRNRILGLLATPQLGARHEA